VFNNPRTLAEITGLTVLGSISLTWIDRKKAESRLRKLAWSGAAAGLLLVFGLVVLFQSPGARFMQRLVTWSFA
jgi:protein tyrosine kinase modulator